MEIKSITDPSFAVYGRVVPADTKEFIETMAKEPATAEGTTVYYPSVAAFEALPLFCEMQDTVFGELPIEFGYCNGYNTKLNAVEYHRSSEIDIAATDLVLLLGRQQDIEADFTYDTAKIEAFAVPAGTAVELYATTLHFAPCRADGKEFRCGVILPKGTNEALTKPVGKDGEHRLLFANNKWLIAHEASGLQNDGAFIGLKGANPEI